MIKTEIYITYDPDIDKIEDVTKGFLEMGFFVDYHKDLPNGKEKMIKLVSPYEFNLESESPDNQYWDNTTQSITW